MLPLMYLQGSEVAYIAVILNQCAFSRFFALCTSELVSVTVISNLVMHADFPYFLIGSPVLIIISVTQNGLK